MGYPKEGDRRVGDFKDAGQREFAGQVTFRALADLILSLSNTPAATDQKFLDTLGDIEQGEAAAAHVHKATGYIADALTAVRNISSFFVVSLASCTRPCPIFCSLVELRTGSLLLPAIMPSPFPGYSAVGDSYKTSASLA